MADNNSPEPPDKVTKFEQAGEEQPMGLLAEFWLFIREEKKWWLTPIVLVLLLAGVAIFLSGTGAAPFIYTLF
ncbi:MAG: hypothetical protein DWI00_03265 [Planctomycetota bacterium]|nr:MAG: hypothetical protein DWI00_03265 [Planctomycetota bacterium]